jgi:transposase
MLLDQIDSLSAQTARLTGRIAELIGAIPAAQGVDPDGSTGLHAELREDAPVIPALAGLDEIPGISRATAQGIIAEIGLDITRFPTPGHLVSWAKLSPRTFQSGPGTGRPEPNRVLCVCARAPGQLRRQQLQQLRHAPAG